MRRPLADTSKHPSAESDFGRRQCLCDVLATSSSNPHHQIGERPSDTSQTELLSVNEDKQRRKRSRNNLEFEALPSFSSIRMWTRTSRSDIARGSHRLTQAMSWIHEIEQAQRLSDSAAARSITGIAAEDFETLDSKIASGLERLQRRRVRARQQSKFLLGRPTAWLIFEHFKINDTDGTVLAPSDFLQVELRNDDLQSFVAKWDETIIAMSRHSHEEILKNLYFRQLRKI